MTQLIHTYGDGRAMRTLEWLARCGPQHDEPKLQAITDGDVVHITVRTTSYQSAEDWGRYLKIAFSESHSLSSWRSIDQGAAYEVKMKALVPESLR